MPSRYRIPIMAITVFGASALLAVSVGIVLYLGFNQATQTTRQLWAEQAETMIDTIETNLENRLHPIRDRPCGLRRMSPICPIPQHWMTIFSGCLPRHPR